MIDIGFKATDKNLRCRDYQYNLGKQHLYEGKIILCSQGFHFCKKIKDVAEYYTPETSRLFIVTHGENYLSEDNKCVTDTITFLEEITKINIFYISKKYNIELINFLLWFYYDINIMKLLINAGADVYSDVLMEIIIKEE